MEKRLIIAIILSITIIMVFQHFTAKPSPTPPAPVVPVSGQPTIVEPRTESHSSTGGHPWLSGARVKEAEEAHPLTEVRLPEKELEVETDKFILTFSDIGGAIKGIRLKEYKTLTTSEPLKIVEIEYPQDYIFNLIDPAGQRVLNSIPYILEKKDGEITYTTNVKDVEVSKKYILRNSSNGIELQLTIHNKSESPISFVYRILGGSGIKEASAEDAKLIEIISKINGKIAGYKHPKDKRIINPGIASWTALKNKYFSIILKPFIQTKNQFYGETKEKSLFTGVEVEDFVIPPMASAQHKFVIYVGPSKISTLQEFGFELEESINYGFFGGIAKVMLSIMGIFYTIVHNWGVAIIILSVFLNIVLFPLSLKSFNSMKKMQELQPQIEKLKVQCKGNAQKLNKEMLELYKKYKINPLSGCLPLLLQMPIFIALYQALMKSIDLRGAKFLWIKDLSMPDAVKIPAALPIIGNSINILPILMIIGMVIQQKISASSSMAVTEEQKQQQKMMLILMPIMFGFIFYNMPSGLVLYWLVNTVLTIFEQSMIFRKI